MPERMTVDYIRGAVESLGLPHTEAWRRATGMDQQDKSPAEERPTLIEYIPEANQTVILFTTEISRQPVLAMTVLFDRNGSFSTVYYPTSEIDSQFQPAAEAAVIKAQQRARDQRHNP